MNVFKTVLNTMKINLFNIKVRADYRPCVGRRLQYKASAHSSLSCFLKLSRRHRRKCEWRLKKYCKL